MFFTNAMIYDGGFQIYRVTTRLPQWWPTQFMYLTFIIILNHRVQIFYGWQKYMCKHMSAF